MWNGWTRDIRYAMRTILRDPGFFLFAVVIVGVGIGANTAIFSIVNPLLLRPLPFRDAERLVWIANSGTGGRSAVTSRTSNLRDWRRLNASFEALTGYNAFFDYDGYNLVGEGEPQRLVGAGVAGNFLEVLGVRPLLGRSFVDEETVWNGRPAAVLTHGFWERRYGADPEIVGRSITLNDRPTTIVGVLPPSFDFASTFTPGTRVDILVPFPISDETNRWGNTLSIIGRLKPGVTLQAAQAELDLINRQLKAQEPDRWGLGASVTGLREQITSPFRRSLWLLACAVGLVLLIACTNLSNLLLARSSARRKEVAVRSALGASRARLMRQMLTESLLLSGCGALFGVGIAVAATRLVSTTSATAVSIPLLQSVAVDGTALLFTVTVAGAAGLLFGMVPALSVSKGRQSEILAGASRGSSEGKHGVSTREVLVVSEVALALVLLVSAGLLLRSFLTLMDVELGFRPENTIAWEIEPGPRFTEATEARAFHERLVRAVQSLPGVASVGMSDTLPLGRNRSWTVGARGELYDPEERPTAFPRVVDHGYIPTMGIALTSGRNFTVDDVAGKDPVVVVNEDLARRLWPARDPIGQVLNIGREEWHVVGVVGNVRHRSLEETGGLEMYLPFTQKDDYASMQLVVRASLHPDALVPSVKAALKAAVPDLPTDQFQTLGAIVDRAVSPRRFILMLLGAFASTALVLSALGIYSVLSYSVSQRSREIGLRMALGASARRVQANVVARTLTLTAVGVLVGCIGALGLTSSIASLLYGVRPLDPATVGVVVPLMFVISGLAAYVPARRASSIEPMSVLRSS